MCLVSYSPTPDGYIICSNRDESPSRALSPLKVVKTQSVNLLCPLDHKGGSWIICSDSGVSICILNGAFQNHKRRLDYRMSRGLMMKQFFEHSSTSQFLFQFDFEKIEPFTMLIRDKKGLYEFRWDGRHKFIKHLDENKLHVWSSCTLYTPGIQKQREEAFRNLYSKTNDYVQEILRIHSSEPLGDSLNDFVMNRDDRVATISISLLENTEDGSKISHHDLRNGGTVNKSLKTKH